jgi:predicted kinase
MLIKLYRDVNDLGHPVILDGHFDRDRRRTP